MKNFKVTTSVMRKNGVDFDNVTDYVENVDKLMAYIKRNLEGTDDVLLITIAPEENSNE